MSIFVAGATGNTGGAIAAALLGRKERVVVLVRDEAKAGALAEKGAEVVRGDLLDEKALERALEGVSAAYVLVPPNMTVEKFGAYQDQVSAALYEGLKKAGTPRVVLLSSIGADLASGTGPIAGLHRTEKLLSKLDAAVTFLRPAYFLENFASSLGGLRDGVFPTFFPGDFEFESVATKDIAEVAVEELLRKSSGLDVVDVYGPEKVSAKAAAQVFSELTGKELKLLEAPPSTMAAALVGYGFQQDLAAQYQEMTETMIAGRLPSVAGDRLVRGRTKSRDVFAKLLGGAA